MRPEGMVRWYELRTRLPIPRCHLGQWTVFLYDPAGNTLEFKAFADDTQVFAA